MPRPPVPQLSSDLAALALETKRKYPEIRKLADSANALASQTTLLTPSEQVAVGLPFIDAICTNNAKVVAISLTGILKLVAAAALVPDHARLVVGHLHNMDLTSQSWEIQLKTLQVLLLIVANYEFDRKTFVDVLTLVGALAHSKQSAVANTASATVQQVLTSLFEKLQKLDEEAAVALSQSTRGSTNGTADPATGNGEAKVGEIEGANSLEKTCEDVLSELITHKNDTQIGLSLRPQAAFEIVENILSLYGTVFQLHERLQHVLQEKAPLALMAIISSLHDFSLTVRAFRVTHLVVEAQVPGSLELVEECNKILGAADENGTEDASIYWKCVLVLELYRVLWRDFSTVRFADSLIVETLSALNSFNTSEFLDLVNDDPLVLPLQNIIPRLNPKILLLDHLDKQEPPTLLPPFYSAVVTLQVITNFSMSIAKFVGDLSKKASASTIEADVEYVTLVNERVFPQTVQLYKTFLHFPLDSDLFHVCIRGLQQHTHLVGILGLSQLRDTLLVLLAEGVVRTPQNIENKKSGASNLFAFGESLVESISSTIQQNLPSHTIGESGKAASSRSSSENERIWPSRAFNMRQAACLRALCGLASSLGSTLLDSWSIVWATLQWADYFLNGPESTTGTDQKRSADHRLSTPELSAITSLRDKLMESIRDFPSESFHELFLVLSNLYKKTVSAPAESGPIQLCAFNPLFFLDQLRQVSQLDPVRLMLQSPSTWNDMVLFFCELVTNRDALAPARKHAVGTYAAIVSGTCSAGFSQPDTAVVAAKLSISALIAVVNALQNLGRSPELLVFNCEIDMHLTLLSVARKLIDEHDKHYKESWNLVFVLLNSPFIYTQETVSEAKVAEKVAHSIAMSFDILKLILDEFLGTLPFRELRALLDSLVNFCSQPFDLNISFSAVSYFWLVSDNIRANSPIGVQLECESLNDLESVLGDEKSEAGRLNEALHIYLLARLSELAHDSRPQVLEGALQTLFQIIDVYGKHNPSWELLYKIVFPGVLDSQYLDLEQVAAHVPALNLILSGFVSMTTKYLLSFDDPALAFKFWRDFLAFLSSLLALGYRPLNIKIFQTFQDLITPLEHARVPEDFMDLLFDFWSLVAIDYDFVNPDYQDSLAVYVATFEPLHKVLKPVFSTNHATKVIHNLNKCARYPVLGRNQADDTKLTKLQKAIIDSLAVIGTSEDQHILTLLTVQLGVLAAYPYETRPRIEAKILSKFDGKLKIPSFLVLGETAVELLERMLPQIRDMNVLLDNDGFKKLILSLLHSVRHKASGAGETPVWVRSNDIIFQCIGRIVDHDLGTMGANPAFWLVVVDCIVVCFQECTGTEESLVLAHYRRLTAKAVPAFIDQAPDALIRLYLEKLYAHTFLYEATKIEEELFENMQDPDYLEGISQTTGSCAAPRVLPNASIRAQCLQDLFSIASGSKAEPAGVATNYVMCRTLFAIRRYISDARLMLRRPMPRLQSQELAVILAGLCKLDLPAQQVAPVVPFLAGLVPYAGRVDSWAVHVQELLSGSVGEA